MPHATTSHATTIAEFGTSLAIAALGLSTGTAAVLVPVATLTATFAAIRRTRDPAGRAMKAAINALQNAPDFTQTDLATAAAWLAGRPKINLTPATLAAHQGDLPAYLTQLLDDGTLPADGATARILHLCLTAAHQAIRTDTAFHAIFAQDMLAALAKGQGVMIHKQDQVLELVQQLTHSQAEKESLMAALAHAEREFQTTQNMLATFLKIILETEVPPDQFAASLMTFAASWKQAGQRINALDWSHNLTPELDSLRARAKAAFQAEDQALTFAILDELDQAEQADIDALLDHSAQVAQQLQQRQASQRNTRESKLSIAISMGNAQQTVDLLIKLLDNPPDPFNALRDMRCEWYLRYQSHAVPFDGQVALRLARETLARAGDDTQRGTAQNDLGITLGLMGQRAGDVGLMGQSVDAFSAALRVRSEKKTPQAWAMTQTNLGNALQIMGQRAGDDARLSQSADAYRAALRVRSEKDTPQVWAMTQNNLGGVLQIMGQRAGDDALLQQSVDAYRAALRVRSEKDTPQEWAGTQNNLGIVLTLMGQRARDDVLLSQSRDSYCAALRVYSEQDTPQDWAETTENLARLYLAYFDLTGDAKHLTAAQTHASAARAVFARLDAAWYLQNIDLLLDEIARKST